MVPAVSDMRFAYIDSNGNEVPIPSVDALALRIELGAISEDTQLYDAQADEWGPAHTHEIYHSLSRSTGSDSFVAPPPAAPPPAPRATEAPPTPPSSGTGDSAGAAGGATDEVGQEPQPESVGAPEAGPVTAADLGLTLAEPTTPLEPTSPSEPTSPPGPEEPGADGSDFGLDLAPAQPAPEPSDVSGPGREGPEGAVELSELGPDEEEGPSFDFGAMDGGLDFDESFEEDDGAPAMDFGSTVADTVEGFGEDALSSPADMGLETSSPFDAGGFDPVSGGLELEPPMSDFTPGDPPSWMEDVGPAEDEDVLDLSSVGTTAEHAPPRAHRAPDDRPSPPRRRPRRSLTGPLVGAVVIVAGGVGAYAAWPLISARFAASGEPEVQPVIMPPISAELMPDMRAAGEAALAAAFGEVRRDWVAAGGLEAPPQDWLAGLYLANASGYGGVEAFWSGMRDYLDGVRAIDLAVFDEAYRAEMTNRGVTEEDAAAMRERADSGFVAAAEAREATLLQVEALIDAAIRLHRFLEANEANIEHAPASAVTTDPVLEVSPATEEIGTAMGDLIDDVTAALAALDYREQVSAAGIWSTVLSRVQESGIQ
jgi:hypothetical protein